MQLHHLLSEQVRNSDLYTLALSHRSVGKRNNERLEFLGDSILGYVIADALFSLLDDASEGYMTRLRASLVNESSLAEIANALSLSDKLIMGQGEYKSGGFRRESVLSDTVEAIIACVYLVEGMASAKQFILSVYQERLKNLPSEDELKDPKTRLQEYLQQHQYSIPEYQLVEVSGQDHQQIFTVSCSVPALGSIHQAQASNRKKAEKLAAKKMLDALLNEVEKT